MKFITPIFVNDLIEIYIPNTSYVYDARETLGGRTAAVVVADVLQPFQPDEDYRDSKTISPRKTFYWRRSRIKPSAFYV